MTDVSFIAFCKKTIADYVNEHLDKTDNVTIAVENVFAVWYCKTLQNWKALLSTTLFDGDTMKLHITAIKKKHISTFIKNGKIV